MRIKPDTVWNKFKVFQWVKLPGLFFVSTALPFSASLSAGEADVLDVKVSCLVSCSFSVTVAHKDKGWNHYANRWEVVTPAGKVLATRTLHHPHVDEQPFTRSLRDITIPKGVTRVIVRAHDSVHQYGGKAFEVTLPGQPMTDSGTTPTRVGP